MNTRNVRRVALLTAVLLASACSPQPAAPEATGGLAGSASELPDSLPDDQPVEDKAGEAGAENNAGGVSLLDIVLPSIFPDVDVAQAQIMQYIGQDGGIYFDLDAADDLCRANLESIGVNPEDALVEQLPALCTPYIVDPPDADPIPVARNEDGTYTFTITEDEQQLAIERIEGQLDILTTVTPGVASIIYDDALTDIRIVAESETAAEQAAYSAFFYMRLHRAFTQTGEDIPLTIVTEDTAGTPYEAYTTTRELVLLPVGP